MRRLPFRYLIPALLFAACNTDYLVDAEPLLVVEGWIDHGDFPVVMVSTTVPIREERTDLSALKDYIARWATVTISDGTRDVVLTGRVDRRYFPPYIYTTSEMRGEAGKAYRLTVDYRTYHAEAVTTIPSPPALDSVRVLPCEEDTLWQINAWFHDTPTEHHYYKFFTRVGRDSRMWLSSYMQTLDAATFALGESVCTPVYKGRLVTRRERYVPYFTARDTVLVKLARMDSTSFAFWNQMEHNVTLGNSPLTASRRNPAFNMQGALGYWCGYGAVTWPITIADSIVSGRE